MSVKTAKLIRQIRQAQQLGQAILALTGLTNLNLVYAFATETSLVINCRDYASLWQLDDAHTQIRQAINRMGLGITNIWIEKEGQCAYDL
ncbi:MAG TPA: hypothetical protein IGR64_06620 [Leptolyngbyaceae cyanobacterium M65_K2018_010]|nr:hypothetical protein [Leptolyngbyaceae cyanobacterium M65_K2018_010]